MMHATAIMVVSVCVVDGVMVIHVIMTVTMVHATVIYHHDCRQTHNTSH